MILISTYSGILRKSRHPGCSALGTASSTGEIHWIPNVFRTFSIKPNSNNVFIFIQKSIPMISIARPGYAHGHGHGRGYGHTFDHGQACSRRIGSSIFREMGFSCGAAGIRHASIDRAKRSFSANVLLF